MYDTCPIRCFSYSFVLGLALAGLLMVGMSTGLLVDLYTQDSNTRTELPEILTLIILAQPLNTLVFAADGVIQGASEISYQAKSMALSGVTALLSFAVLEYDRRQSDVDTLVHGWIALLSLQLARSLTSSWKLVDKDGLIDLMDTSTASDKAVPYFAHELVNRNSPHSI